MGKRYRQYSACVSLILFLGLFMSIWSGCNAGNSQSSEPLLETIQNRGKLIAGVKYDSKPFGYLDTDGTVKGYDVDLMRELAKRILGDPNAVEFQQILSSTRVIALNSGTIDVVGATMTITPEREKIIDFTDSYFTARQAVVVPINSPIQALDELSDKTILFVLGTTSEKNIKSRFPNAKYTGFKTATDAFSALRAGRGDAMTTDDTIIAGFLSDICGFRMLEERLASEPYGLALKQDEKANSTNSFRQAINQAIQAMQEDGTLQQLEKKWIEPAFAARDCKK